MTHIINASWRRSFAVVLIVILSLGVLCGGWAYALHVMGNIHEVELGAVYRSAQLSAADISNLIKSKHIKTVLNLRGDNSGSDWYDAEAAAVRQTGAQYINIKMSATREPDPAVLSSLLTTLSTAPTPLLIHCKDGADRTGLAAALYELTVMHKSPETADNQLSFRYGHFPWLTSHTGAMDKAFWQFASSDNQP